jgi:hypothetical protein
MDRSAASAVTKPAFKSIVRQNQGHACDVLLRVGAVEIKCFTVVLAPVCIVCLSPEEFTNRSH